jgi:hypothetical protein
MSMRGNVVAGAAICALMLGQSTVSIAHDPWGLGHKSIPAARSIEFSRLNSIASQIADERARSVLVRLALWDPGAKLKACFFNGSSDREKGMTVAAAKDLLGRQSINIAFDFGDPPGYRVCADRPGENGLWEDVRISFNSGCCAAYIGRTAHGKEAIGTKATVFLQSIGLMTQSKRQQILAHEFLHVLGLHHEHQSPGSTCRDAFDKAAVMEKFGWDEKRYNTNIGILDRDTRLYKWSNYDETSIMRYYFEPELLVKGTDSPCYEEDNLVPSTQDYRALRDAYPVSTTSAAAKERTRAGAATLAAMNLPSDLRDLVAVALRLAGD